MPMDNNYILLQEDTNANYEPTEEEVRAEAKYLGIAPEDSDLMWIAKEALRAPLPRHWSPYQHRETGSIVYYNKKTGAISENHPMDEYFRGLYHKLKDDPTSSRIRSASNSFVPETDFSFASSPSRETRQHRFVFTGNPKPSTVSSIITTSADPEALVKAVNQAAVEVNLYNEWLEETVKSLKQTVDKIAFLENRMKGVMKPSSFVTSA
ncbi:hypothetical protein BLSTO_02613 [Blastocystis sp. subtype 1]